ncbi:hypothetical protein C1H46_034795 [Malus baccata]|uniref:Uncharacterized protein n=1 Tax=Malus baccata TaxID=106549 RepID=A0A540KZK7_MALBA|nr:hypothetical protein C1H46_034795 [Malus baccata]
MHILVHIISSRPQSSQRGPGSDSDSKDEEHEAQQTRNPVDKKPVDFTRSLGPKLKRYNICFLHCISWDFFIALG